MAGKNTSTVFDEIKRLLILEVEKDYQNTIKDLHKVYIRDCKQVNNIKTLLSLENCLNAINVYPSQEIWNLQNKLKLQAAKTKKGESK